MVRNLVRWFIEIYFLVVPDADTFIGLLSVITSGVETYSASMKALNWLSLSHLPADLNKLLMFYKDLCL